MSISYKLLENSLYLVAKMDRSLLIVTSLSIIIAIVIPLAVYALYPEEVSSIEDVVIEHISKEGSPYIRESPRFMRSITLIILKKRYFEGRGHMVMGHNGKPMFNYNDTITGIALGYRYVEISTGRVVSGYQLINLIKNVDSISVKGYIVEMPRGRILIPIEIVVDDHRYVLLR